MEKKLKNYLLCHRIAYIALIILCALFPVFSLEYFMYVVRSIFGLVCYSLLLLIALSELFLLRIKTVTVDGNTITAYQGSMYILLVVNDKVSDKYTLFWPFSNPTLSAVLPVGRKVESRGMCIKVDGQAV